MQAKLSLIIISVVVTVAIAAEPVFTSPQGFSITPPDGWVVASKDTVSQLSRVALDHFQKLGNIDLNKLAVVIFNPAPSAESQNLNVIVAPEKIPIDESGFEDKLAGELREQYTGMGAQLGRVSVSRKRFGAHAGLVADAEWSMAGASLRQWQVILPAGSHTIIVTCTAPQSSFDEVAPVFTKAIESMTYSNVTTSTFEMPVWLRDAVIGAAIGGLIGLFQFFKSR
jgi:hypothetical protein